jgi:hypothetical protein
MTPIIRHGTPSRSSAVGLLFIITLLGTAPLAAAEDISHYRDFTLGTTLDTVLQRTGLTPAAVTTLHARPARLQEVEWRPTTWLPGMPLVPTDPVRQIRFSFYDGVLYRIDVDYAPERTAGLTDEDIVEALTSAYGPPRGGPATATETPSSRLDLPSQVPLGRWEDATHTMVLYRTSSYGKALRLTVAIPATDAEARAAAARALALDRSEAPERARERAARERDAQREADEKSRTVNKPVFRP